MLSEQINPAYIFMIIAISGIYMFVRPFIKWIVDSKSVTLLNYVMSSLLVLVVLFGGIALSAVFRRSMLEVTLHSLAVFGGCLGGIHLLLQVFRNKKKRV
ncbi:hypothetical protein GCM10007063_20390 [Lentibacillus kapialis]|uniref:Uncharacterized protein n=2 Tax=Lentibacillus kapialis TaxID=340214 RepID=A0A917PXU5_9BACI|nr:hypothetical protein GCM10007063_20390 [Lentibacillus kapialis]